MYKIEDNFFTQKIFNKVLKTCREYPISEVPENYDGRRKLYVERNYLTKKSPSKHHFIASLFDKPQKNELLKIEIANDINGFWLMPHSDHPAKKKVIVIYMEGQENNGTTFHAENDKIKIKFIKNRAVHFYPDSLDTWDNSSIKHSVEKIKIDSIRRTLIVNYVDMKEWKETENCWI